MQSGLDLVGLGSGICKQTHDDTINALGTRALGPLRCDDVESNVTTTTQACMGIGIADSI